MRQIICSRSRLDTRKNQNNYNINFAKSNKKENNRNNTLNHYKLRFQIQHLQKTYDNIPIQIDYEINPEYQNRI